MQRKAEIPNKPRFKLATQRAYELLAELEISEFPVNPWKIIKHFPSWHLKGWLELQLHTNEQDPLNIDKEKAEAKTVKVRGSDEYLIIYDERVDNSQRVRWTLAHEIGHIVMGHLVHFDATALNRRGLTKEEYGVLEVEAHYFASDLLAPKTIVRRFDFQDKPQGISLICDISKEAAEKRLKEIKRIGFDYYPTENLILRNFYNHLRQGNYYQVMHDTACKFCPSVIYKDLCKESRICRNCNSFITDENYKFCPVCGKEVPPPHLYSPYRHNGGGMFNIASLFDLYLQGKNYYEIPLGKKGNAGFCPICRNNPLPDNEAVCSGCGFPAVNSCTGEDKTLSHASRYCPDCGAETTFKAIYDRLPERMSVGNIRIPESFDDYIECEYWPFILLTIGYWEKAMDLYVALEDSVALYDFEDIVIFVRSAEDVTLVRQCEEKILNCLTKYGSLPVKRVHVMVADMSP